jgi:hypothetical protein
MKIRSYRNVDARAAAYWILYAVFFFLAATGCSRQSGKGILEVRIKDHEEAIGYFSKVNIGLETVRLSPKIGFRFWRLGWLSLNPSLAELDLTQFVNNSGVIVFREKIDAGSFEAFDLKIRSVRGILKDGSREVAIDNKVKPVALSFSVNPGELTTIVIDLSLMDMSDHPPATYELQLAGYEVYNNGKLVDKVPPG